MSAKYCHFLLWHRHSLHRFWAEIKHGIMSEKIQQKNTQNSAIITCSSGERNHNSIGSSTESSGKSPTVTAWGLANAPYLGRHWKYRRPSTLDRHTQTQRDKYRQINMYRDHRPLKIRTHGSHAWVHELGSIGIFSFLLSLCQTWSVCYKFCTHNVTDNVNKCCKSGNCMIFTFSCVHVLWLNHMSVRMSV